MRSVRIAGKSGNLLCSSADLDSAGVVDLVCHVEIVDLALGDGQNPVEVTLRAETFNGTQIEGTSSLTVVKDCE